LSLQISSQEQVLQALRFQCFQELSRVEQQALKHKNLKKLRQDYQNVFKKFSQLQRSRFWQSIVDRCKTFFSQLKESLQNQNLQPAQSFHQPPATSTSVQNFVSCPQGAGYAMEVDSSSGSFPVVQPTPTPVVFPVSTQTTELELPPQIKRVGQRYFSLDGRELELPTAPAYQNGYVWVVKASSKKEYEVLFQGQLIPMKNLRVEYDRFHAEKEAQYLILVGQLYGPEGQIHYLRSGEKFHQERRAEVDAKL
jgi:hypothetical protein